MTREQTLAVNADVIETFRANGGEMPEGIRCTATTLLVTMTGEVGPNSHLAVELHAR